jgi:CO/xanthine dehydrogenase FAD-binding subunit
MTPFRYARPRSLNEAVRDLSGNPGAALLAGGTCLVDLMKQGVERPASIVDLNFVPELTGISIGTHRRLKVRSMTRLVHAATSRRDRSRPG